MPQQKDGQVIFSPEEVAEKAKLGDMLSPLIPGKNVIVETIVGQVVGRFVGFTRKAGAEDESLVVLGAIPELENCPVMNHIIDLSNVVMVTIQSK